MGFYGNIAVQKPNNEAVQHESNNEALIELLDSFTESQIEMISEFKLIGLDKERKDTVKNTVTTLQGFLRSNNIKRFDLTSGAGVFKNNKFLSGDTSTFIVSLYSESTASDYLGTTSTYGSVNKSLDLKNTVADVSYLLSEDDNVKALNDKLARIGVEFTSFDKKKRAFHFKLVSKE